MRCREPASSLWAVASAHEMQGAGVELMGGGLLKGGLGLIDLAERQFDEAEVLVANNTGGGKCNALFELRQRLVVLAEGRVVRAEVAVRNGVVGIALHPELVGLRFFFEFAGNDEVVVGGDAQFLALAHAIAKLVGPLEVFRGAAGLSEVRVV